MNFQTTGEWGSVFNTTIIGIHQVLMEDGRVLFWGGDGNGNAFSNTQKYGIFDPATGEHEILEADHVVRMFCGAGVVLPGTDKVLIAGGNGTGAAGGQLFDLSDEELTRDGANNMDTGRFYPTMLSLPTGQAVILGGNGNADKRGTPEIFTLNEGWRSLDGAADADVAANWWYPKAWLNDSGEIVYIAINKGNQNGAAAAASTLEVMAMDPSGNGSIRKIGDVPFSMDVASTAAMYDVGKIVVMSHAGDLWYMDINGPTPTFSLAADLDGDRNNSDMTVMADGRILINGGTKVGNSQSLNDARLESLIFDPYTGEVTVADSEDVMRLYHSSSVLLADGTILSMGGGGLNGTLDFMDAQIYKPDYLYNDDGTLADRPEISAAPGSIEPGDTFVIDVDDASTIARMSFVKTGAVTHSVNMESGRMDLDFKVQPGNRIEVTIPENPNLVTAGNWMLFAIDDQGVPSVAPIISVEPVLAQYDGIGDITAEYFTIDANATSLDQIDFNGEVIHTERLVEINESGSGAFFEGGPADDFAVKYSGDFAVSRGGEYTFHMTSDDGSRLFIDGEEVLDNDGMHGPIEKTVKVNLDSGIHSIEMLYFEGLTGGRVDLDWSGPGFARKQMQFDGAEKNLLENGSFEGGPVGLGKAPTGWSVEGAAGRSESDTRASTGDGFVALGGWSNAYGGGAISQTVETVVGQTYNLSFDLKQSLGATVATKVKAEALNGSVADLSQTVSGSFDGAEQTHISLSFVATGTQTTLKISDVTSGSGVNYDIDLDNVILSAGEAITPPPPNPDNIINGTNGSDYLVGTDANDLINLKGGQDVVRGSAGNDTIVGDAASYDQVDYDGRSSDYRFTVNADGTVRVEKPDGTVDNLTSIDGFWFLDEAVWKPIEDVLELPDGPIAGETINGTNQDDYLRGSVGDDIINGRGGLDVILESSGNDTIDGGGAEYDQVDYLGKSTDYTFTANSDGSISVKGPNDKSDILIDIDGIWFAGDGKWSAIEDLVTGGEFPDQTINGTAGNDYITGTAGNDTINAGAGRDVIRGSKGDDTINGGDNGYNQVDYAGSSQDFVFTQNADGSYTATSADTGTDLLTDIGGIWFETEEEWYNIDDLV